MPIVKIEHPIKDYETWKAAFDRDPIDRKASGVRRYRIFRPIDDLLYIAVDLEFDSLPEAEACQASLEALWRSPQAAPALGGTPRARIVDAVESHEY